jgi:hypothetical protein
MKAERRADLAWAAGLFLAGAALYLSFLSKVYVFEGLARAMPIELGEWKRLLNGNYLAYGVMGAAFHHLLGLFGLAPLAVVSLQALDALLGGAGLALHFAVQRALGASRPAAAAWAAALAVTLGWWTWSAEAENYVFSAVLVHALFLGLALRLAGRKVPAWALGALHALAMTGHIVNGVMGLACVYALWTTTEPRRRAKELGVYILTGGLCIGAAYGLALAVVRPESAARWFLGSAATSEGLNTRDVWTLANLGVWLGTSGRAVAADPWGPAVAVLALAAAFGLSAQKGLRRAAAIAAGLQLLAYALVFTRWEPYTGVYRVPDLPAFILLLSLAVPARWSAPSGAALAALLAAANLGAASARADAGQNPRLARMEALKAASREGDWAAGEGGDELYIPYFAQRRPLVLGRFRGRPEAVRKAAADIAAHGQSLYLFRDTVKDPFWAPHWAELELEAVVSDGEGPLLYRAGGVKKHRKVTK